MSLFSVRSVLLVDDDKASLFLSTLFIENLELDIEVFSASHGKEALEVLEENNIKAGGGYQFTPCLIILDINMPVMNGWQFLDAYQKRFPKELQSHIVIAMMTVSEDERDFIRAMKNPFINEYISKPLTDEKVLELMEKYF
jgi:CheY-like chemotaxis protein